MKHSKLAIGMIGGASALVLALSPSAALAHHGHHHHHGHNLLRGDLTPSMPTDAAINLVPPGGLPWVISRGEVRVRDNGRMDVRIEGLQIPFAAPDVTRNPVPNIHAVLYCSGMAAADSGSHPMSVPGGDSRFRVTLMVPETCDDAVVLIQPDSATAPGTPANAYIASVMAAPADDDD
jgi:hypothetical protein